MNDVRSWPQDWQVRIGFGVGTVDCCALVGAGGMARVRMCMMGPGVKRWAPCGRVALGIDARSGKVAVGGCGPDRGCCVGDGGLFRHGVAD